MKKTKYFDKKMYETEKKIKTAFIILVLFLLGMYIGLAIDYLEIQNKENKIFELQVDLDSKKEVIHRQKLQLNSYEEQFNRITIEERREAK